jgi:hypothetical protein
LIVKAPQRCFFLEDFVKRVEIPFIDFLEHLIEQGYGRANDARVQPVQYLIRRVTDSLRRPKVVLICFLATEYDQLTLGETLRKVGEEWAKDQAIVAIQANNNFVVWHSSNGFSKAPNFIDKSKAQYRPNSNVVFSGRCDQRS